MPIDDEHHAKQQQETGRGMRRRWFPPIWIGALVLLCAVVTVRAEDLGVVNLVYKLAVALGVVGLAVWVIRSSGWRAGVRWPVALVPCLLLVAFYARLLPVEAEMDGDAGIVGWRWRWEEPDLQLRMPSAADPSAVSVKTSADDYPAFLGGGPWPEIEHVKLATDWSTQPPEQLWRRPVGAGWSGFAVAGEHAVTQEQRGDQELVVCYDVKTGEPLWYHGDSVRWDPSGGGALGGIGPRATPTLDEGRVYAHGATGILNCLDLETGELLWSHDTLAKHDAQNVTWGKAGSPLVTGEMVLVSVGGRDDQSLVAYDKHTGEVIWSAGTRQSSYATPALMTLDGKQQIVCVNQASVTSHDPVDGTVLWEHPWPNDSGANAAASQPLPAGDDRVWLSMGYGVGAELIQVARDNGQWKTKRLWKRPVLKTKLTNVVLRDGYAYGISDGRFFECIEIKSGKPLWRERRSPRFGHGQILLVGDLFLVTCESGDVVLAQASPQGYQELGAFQAIEGITWNNPALTGDRLLVRNAEEAACFQLPLARVKDEG